MSRPCGPGIALMGCLLIGMPMGASPAFASESWGERAIVEHVDRQDFAGVLARARLLELISLGEVKAKAIYDLLLPAWHDRLERDDNGVYLVPLFADLKRHEMTDLTVDAFGNELLSQRFIERDVFQTTELWGVGSTGSYGHRGDMTTLDEVIRAHGGEARPSRGAYVEAEEEERSDLIGKRCSTVTFPMWC